jgi:cytochrome P450
VSAASPSSAEVAFLDVANPAFSLRSDVVRAARDASWYARTPYGIAVLRHDAVKRLVKDRRLGQGSKAWPAHNGVTGPWAGWWERSLLNLVGEEHARQRRLLNPGFSLRAVTTYAEGYPALANELIDAFAARGTCEFMGEFAEPYSARIIARLLGSPEDEWRTIADWSATMGLALGVTFKRDLPKIEAALDGLLGYADAVIAAHVREPRDDFATRLVGYRDEGRLTDQELRETVVNVIFGGMDTTRNQLGLAMHVFLEHPDQWALLGEHPELGPAAVEEVMRVRPVTTWVTREALVDFTFDDVEIRKGTTIHLLTESSGTDPAAVPDRRFDITAERPPHFAFGGGAHHCLGHFLARRDLSEALVALASRLGPTELAGDVRWLPDSGNTGPVVLGVRFDPARAARA